MMASPRCRLDQPSAETEKSVVDAESGELGTLVKERTVKGFGKRLGEIRRRRGLTQGELGAAVGVSNRVIAYYEQDDAQPPGPLLAELARALKASTDETPGSAADEGRHQPPGPPPGC